jgi:hypothetical protein
VPSEKAKLINQSDLTIIGITQEYTRLLVYGARSAVTPCPTFFRARRAERDLLQLENTLQEFIMANQPKEQIAPDDKSEKSVDDAVADTFPASDPPSHGGVTRIESDGDANGQTADESDVPGTEPDEDNPDEQTPAEPSPGDTPPDEEAPQGDKSE